VNPVVEGIVRCKQKIRGDKDHSKVVPILLHGDCRFLRAGRHLRNAEPLRAALLAHRRHDHVIVNTQIGFTTPPHETRSRHTRRTCEDDPGADLHVNGDDPRRGWAPSLRSRSAEVQVRRVIDLWCYRRFGHNEQDEPMFTQPKMYKQIKEHKTTRDL
jgi:2-oxoglutarate dehydrogenase E1 component